MNQDLHRLRTVLIKTNFKNAEKLNYPIIFQNKTEPYFQVLNYFFKTFCPKISKQISDAKYQVQGQTGDKFLISVWKIMRDFFNVQLKLSLAQFQNEQKFGLQKIILITTVAETFYQAKRKIKKVKFRSRAAGINASVSTVREVNASGCSENLPFSRSGRPIELSIDSLSESDSRDTEFLKPRNPPKPTVNHMESCDGLENSFGNIVITPRILATDEGSNKNFDIKHIQSKIAALESKFPTSKQDYELLFQRISLLESKMENTENRNDNFKLSTAEQASLQARLNSINL